MALYKVLPHCKFFKPGTYVEDGDDGFVQAVEVETQNGRLVPMGFKGIMIPLQEVRDDLLRIQKRGLDKSW